METLIIQNTTELSYIITLMKVMGKLTFLINNALLNKGAILFGENPAIPQPIGVTRKCSSGCAVAYSMNWSTYGLMVSTGPCMVGIA